MGDKIDLVLLIDDNKATNFYNLTVIGKHKSYKEVLATQSAEEALVYLTSAKEGLAKLPNLIFLDLNMPRMNGWEFLNAFKKLSKNISFDIKIIVLTTSSDEEEKKKITEHPSVTDYFTKPMSAHLLNLILDLQLKKPNT